ncbi:MAG TPA: AMP-binding protein [Polyangia bacterium]
MMNDSNDAKVAAAVAPPSSISSPSYDLGELRSALGIQEGRPFNLGALLSDRHCAQGRGDHLALVWENHTGLRKSFTFNDLSRYSNAWAHKLAELGVTAGDRVCLFVDRVPDLYFAFLGILKLGAVAQPLFSQFMADALEVRLADADTRAVITSPRHLEKVRSVRPRLPALAWVILTDVKAGAHPALGQGEVAMAAEEAPTAELTPFPANDDTPSLLHYTSGTTGRPKGAQHVHGSVLSQYATTRHVLDLRPDDVYWCTADPGWVTGTSYGIIGPWAVGATQAILEAGFSAQRWYEFIARHHVTVFYTAPTAIRMLMKAPAPAPEQLASLRHMCSVGEPLNPAAVLWAERVMGRPFHDTYWQTETGAIMITNMPGLPIKPGSMGKPVPGITAAILDAQTFQPITVPGKPGLIAFRPPWPSMFRGYFKAEQTYQSKFVGDYYLTGDRGSVDSDGYYWFVGRDDDVINTAGHLVGPFEVESALLRHPAVAESAAVSKPDPTYGEVVKSFIVLRPGHTGSDELKLDIMNFVRKHLSPLAMPHAIDFVEKLPKTRSGKIVRRMLRAQEWGEPVGDLSSLDD